MKPNILKLFLLLTVVGVEAGCASSEDRADDSSPAPQMEAIQSTEPVPAHDESHGWGANIQNMTQQGSPNH